MSTKRSGGLRSIISATVAAIWLAGGVAWAGATPGAAPKNFKPPKSAAVSSANSLAGFYDVTGKVYLSTDGAGTNESSTGIDVEKRSTQSKVRVAYLLAASTGFTNFHITDGQITLNGVPVDVDESTEIANSISSFNIRADVTSIVKPLLDAAPVGITTLPVSEANTGQVDGEILAVVFDDPTQPETSINLFYGAQQTTGDQFNIRLGEPVQASNTGQQLTFALGISYGFQPSGQFSTIDVNGVRLTTAAGGQDDGAPQNGALITVGGLGDSTDNPADPFGTDGCPSAPRCDDELYNLKAVLADGTTEITVDTLNPSNDDNIFFASLISKGTVAIVNEGILLTPTMSTKQNGQTATVTAVVQDDTGTPVQGRTVSFATVGPNGGSPPSGPTDSGGSVDFVLSCAVSGTNTITASFVDSRGVTKTSNTATVVCQPSSVPPENCHNGIDDDGDGLIDGADPDCVPLSERYCNGLLATIVGTNASELIVGTPRADVIIGRGGKDIILGRGGDDTICTGSGGGVVYAGDGNDNVTGGSGNDIIFLGRGNDVGDGKGGKDFIDGGSGTDTCTAEVKIHCP